MPIYEYSCEKCAKVFETVQKFSDPPLTACPTCGSAVEKLISRTSFQLKGTGWYATDYKKPKGSTTTSAATSTEASSSTNKESKKGGGDSSGP